jgi:hypothetical protein
MDAREVERQLLTRCVLAARDPCASSADALEANVFRLAAMVVRSEFPLEWRNLTATSQRYFDAHPGTLSDPEEVVRKGWIANLPRLRDLLRAQLRAR